MAGRAGIVIGTGISTGSATKTILQLLAAANHAIEIVEVAIGFHGTTNTNEPILVELIRQTDAGTGGTAVSPEPADDSIADSFDTTALKDISTTEPSDSSEIVRTFTIHPQTGLVYQVHDKAPIIVGANDRIGLRTTAANSVNCDAHICFVE